MANVTIHTMTSLASVATDDELAIYDLSAGTTKRATVTAVLGSRITGTGTLATGTFTGTIPATMTFAGRDVTNTYTKTQTVSPDTNGSNGLAILMPAATSGTALVIQQNAANALRMVASDTASQLIVDPRDLGNNVAGPLVSINRNTSAGAVGPSAGSLGLTQANGNPRRLWVDNSADLRIHNAQPSGSTGSPTVSDTAGTVVGTQTSMAEAKYIAGELSTLEDVLGRVRAGAAAVRRFVYRSGRFNGEQFEGVVTDYAAAYGMDRDAEHPQGKSLNEIQILGDLLRVVEYLLAKETARQG